MKFSSNLPKKEASLEADVERLAKQKNQRKKVLPN